jgi:hypothetical protein
MLTSSPAGFVRATSTRRTVTPAAAHEAVAILLRLGRWLITLALTILYPSCAHSPRAEPPAPPSPNSLREP